MRLIKLIKNIYQPVKPKKEIPVSDPNTEACLQDLYPYFEMDLTDPQLPDRARRIVQKHGAVALSLGFAIVAHNLQTRAQYLSNLLLLGSLTQQQLNAAMTEMLSQGLVKTDALVEGAGEDTLRYITGVLLFVSDDDVRALAAYTMGTKRITHGTKGTVDDHLAVQLLEQAQSTTVGTSCSMAIAFAQHVCGQPANLEAHLRSGHFFALNAHHALTQPAPMVQIAVDAVLLEVLALDIASDGLAYQTNNRGIVWVRKQYTK